MRLNEGERFNRLTAHIYKHNNPETWIFKCDCGVSKEISIYPVLKGVVKSCGCLKKEHLKKYQGTYKKHGLYKSSEYGIWHSMISRCSSEAREYDRTRYFNRGIAVCKEWKDSFENFYKDMGIRPDPEHSLDRIDNNLGYFKENCRWASAKTQQRNRSSNRLFTISGVTKCVAEWADYYGVPWATMYSRLVRTPEKLKLIETDWDEIFK